MLSRFDKGTNKYTYSLRFNTKALYKRKRLLFYQEQGWHNNKKGQKRYNKVIPNNFYQIISPLSLSIWFMDDGGKGGNSKNGIVIDCSNYNSTSIDIIQDTLWSKYSIKTSFHKSSIGSKYKSIKLFVLKDSAFVFKDIVSPYIIESIQYKLCHLV